MQSQKTIKKAIFFLITSIVFQSTIFASNNIVTKNYVLNQFSTLKISNSFQVEFKHSNENKVSVEIDENTLKNLSATSPTSSSSQVTQSQVAEKVFIGGILGGSDHSAGS